MNEIDYVRFHAAADQKARAEAIVELRGKEAENFQIWRAIREQRETMLADIWALMQPDADRAAIWARYGDEIKAKIATKAEANGWRREGKGWAK